MSARFIMKCPVYMFDTDDNCGEQIEIEATKAEPATMWYPGAPEEFEIIECYCGHKDVIEEDYQDEVWEFIRDFEVSRAVSEAEAAYERWKDDHPGQSYMGLR